MGNEFHVHNDVELLTEYPIAFTALAECYIMQEDRVVFIGMCSLAARFIRINEGQFKKDIWKGEG